MEHTVTPTGCFLNICGYEMVVKINFPVYSGGGGGKEYNVCRGNTLERLFKTKFVVYVNISSIDNIQFYI